MTEKELSSYLTNMYTKAFLEELRDHCKNIDLITFVMVLKRTSFTQAVEDIAAVLGLEPVYIKSKSKMKSPYQIAKEEASMDYDTFHNIMKKLESEKK